MGRGSPEAGSWNARLIERLLDYPDHAGWPFIARIAHIQLTQSLNQIGMRSRTGDRDRRGMWNIGQKRAQQQYLSNMQVITDAQKLTGKRLPAQLWFWSHIKHKIMIQFCSASISEETSTGPDQF